MKPSNPKLKSLQNDDLAKRLQSDYVRLQTGRAAPSKAATAAAPPASSEASNASPAIEDVSEQDVQALFQALLRGSTRRLGREPTVHEMVRLVETVKTRRLDAVVTVARAGELEVHWDGSRWVFGPTPSPGSSEESQQLQPSEVD